MLTAHAFLGFSPILTGQVPEFLDTELQTLARGGRGELGDSVWLSRHVAAVLSKALGGAVHPRLPFLSSILPGALCHQGLRIALRQSLTAYPRLV